MTLNITGAKLYGWHPGNSSPSPGDADYLIDGNELSGMEISNRAGELKDNASVDVDNYGGKYTGTVDHGDRVALYVTGEAISGSSSGASWGRMSYGQGSYSQGYVHQWTGLVAPYEIDAQGAKNYELAFTGEDFVYSILGDRRHTRRYESAPIAGSENAILDTALREEAPELDRSEIADIPQTTDMVCNGMTLLDLLRHLMQRGSFIPAADDTSLVVRPQGSVAPEWPTGPGDGDFSPPTLKSNDDDLYNRIRVAGGTGRDVDASQTNQSAYTRVTESDRVAFPVDTGKAELAAVAVWTQTTGSEEGVTVRIQKGDGNGNPVNPDEERLDLANKELAYQFLDDDGFTTFNLPDNYIPGGDRPHVIIQSTGVNGQDIGVNGTGAPAFKAYYPYPVAVLTPDAESINEYRRRDQKITDNSLDTFTAAEARGDAALAEMAQPQRTLTAEAYSYRAHKLQPLDSVQITDDNLGVDGEYVVMQKDEEFDGSVLHTTLTLRAKTSL